MDSRK